MTEAAELIAENAPAAKDREVARRLVTERCKAALLADLRGVWRECNDVMTLCAQVGEALKADRMTPLEAMEQLGPEFCIWMITVAARSRRESDGG